MSIQGRLTLLLGPPSCGKTTFLYALAGRLKASAYTGQVTYNGHGLDEFCAARTVAFVEQHDTHIPNLTALETTEFSYNTQNGSLGVRMWACFSHARCVACVHFGYACTAVHAKKFQMSLSFCC
jgi:ABC-type multidrug transport system ATPase subunit